MSCNAWKEYKLSEIMSIIGGGTPKTRVPEYWDGNIPWLSVKDFAGDNRFVYNTEKHITEEGLNNSSTKMLDKGDLIISARGTVGEIAQLKYDMAFNQSCYGLKANENTTNDFLYYLLNHIIKHIKNNTHGSVFDTITRKTFDNIFVKIPSLIEQKKILRILSSLDYKIELNNQINQTLEEMAQAIFKHWFVDFEFPDENGEPYKSSGGKFVESELGMIPEKWEVKLASQVANVNIGRTPPRKEHHWFSEDANDIRWVSIKDMGNTDVYINRSSEYLTHEAVEKFNVRIIPDNTLILSFKFTLGRLAITVGEMLTNEAIAHFNINDSSITTEYLYNYLMNFNYNTLGSTSSIATAINSKMVRAIPVLLPSKKLMNEFQSIIDSLFQKIKLNVLEMEELIELRDVLLPKLMSGEIRIPDAEQEVEACLQKSN